MPGGEDKAFVEAQKQITHKEGVVFNATEQDIAAVRELQKDMPLVSRPFQGYAEAMGISEDDLLTIANGYQQSGVMRRFSAVLRHHKAGFRHNVMAVWIVPEDRWEECGSKMAVAPNVSHCYRRPTYAPDWPYTHFTMIHGTSPEDCEASMKWIKAETGLTEYACLTSLKELKKIRLKYYMPELDSWDPSKLGALTA
jgi:siroheme decarboxylase